MRRFSSRPAGPSAEPTILLVGADRSFHTAIASALAQHGVYVETSPISGVVDTVVATAPDLVVLVGEAASAGGSEALASLNASPHTSVVPVALLADDSALGERLRAFRHGAAAVIPRSASVDAIADHIARLAREIPERDNEGLGNIGEATLRELVEALSKELRSGILTVRGAKSPEDAAIRVVLGGGRPLAQTIDEFVARIRRHVVHAEPLEYEFDERAGGTIQLLGPEADPGGALGDVTGFRVLLADQNAARADAVAQALREHDAQVVVTDFVPSDQRFGRLRQFDPAIFLIDEPSLRGDGYKLVRRMRRDTRLRWASLLVLDWENIWSAEEESPTVERMLGTLSTLAEPENSLRERLETMPAFDTRLEVTGPARLLRGLAQHTRALRVYVYNPRVNVRIDLSDKLISGARAQVAGGQTLDGTVALSALLVLSAGRVHIARIDEPELVNVMATVDVALNQAELETPPLQPSLPAMADDGFSLPPPPESRGLPRWLWLPLGLLGVGLVAGGVVLAASPADGKIWSALRGERRSAATPAQPAQGPQEAAAPASSALGPAIAPAASSVAPTVEPPPAPSAEAAALPSDDELVRADLDPAEMTLKIESQKTARACEDVVGPSWKLLMGGQPARAKQEVAAGRRGLIIGKLEDAQMAFCRAAVLDAANPDPFTALIRLYLLMRDSKKANEWAELAMKHHSDNPTIRGLYGDALARLGEVERAVNLWLTSANISPNDAPGLRKLGFTFVAAGDMAMGGTDYAQADRLYRRAALIDTSSALAAAGLARALLLQNELKAAAPWAMRAVALDPRHSEIRLTLGDIYEKLGFMDRAYKEWGAAFELDPRNGRAYTRIQRIPGAVRSGALPAPTP